MVLLTLAGLAIPFALLSWLPDHLPVLFLRLFRSLTFFISLLIICEFAGPSLLPFSLWLIPFSGVLAACVLLLLSHSRPRFQSKIRTVLIVALCPFVLSDLIYLERVVRYIYGLTVLYFAAHTLTIGYVLLLRDRRASNVPPNSPYLPRSSDPAILKRAHTAQN
jgi:hypothetical protein